MKGVKSGAGKIMKGLKSAGQRLGIIKKSVPKSASNIKNIKGSGQFAQIIRGSRPKRGEGFVSGVDSLML